MSGTGRRRTLLTVVTVLRDDQAALLEPFVTALRDWGGDLIDEICVYDTTTAHLAAAEAAQLGIREKRGYWDRELGRSRNEAVAMGTSPWVLVLDPDERPLGDVNTLRRLLRAAEEDILLAEVSHGGPTARFGRVLRRGSVSYIASESEFTFSAFTPQRSFQLLPTEALEIRLTRGDMDRPGELPRRLARLVREVGDGRGGCAERVAETRLLLAAEYRSTGRLEQALHELEDLAHGDTSDSLVRAALEARADLLVGLGRFELADHVLQLLESGPNPEFAAWLRLHWLLAQGESRPALQMLRVQEAPTATGGDPLSSEAVLRLRFRVSQRVTDPHETLTSLLALMTIGQEINGRGKLLLKLWGRRSPGDLAEVILSTGTGHIEAISQELQRTSSAGTAVARELSQRGAKHSVAAVIIARDEARCIERCVRSILPWVDEVVVADTGSTDDTARLAAVAGARVVHVPWTDDFAAARNAALDAAGADWHVIVDADEILAGGGAELADLHDLTPEHVLTVNVISTFALAGGTEVEVEPQSRIIPGEVRYAGIIHETPQHEYPVSKVTVTIEHDGYEPQQLGGKLPRREELLRAAIDAEPDSVYLRYQLARNLETQQRLEDAAAEYAQVEDSDVSDEGWHHILIVQYAHTLTSLGRGPEALALLAENADRYDESPDFHFVSGNVLLDLATADPRLAYELLPQAVREFHRCLEIGERNDLPGHVTGRGGHLARRNLQVVAEGCRSLGIPVPFEDDGTDTRNEVTMLPGEKTPGAAAPSPGAVTDGALDVVMIVKNEERSLGRALRSMAALCPLLGQICVYDTGSSDGTIELARSLGARVVEGYWDDNYSRARNAAAAMSDSDWLLVVDADEAVHADPAALAVELAKADAAGREVLTVEVAPDVTYAGRGKEWMSPRLYRPDCAEYARPVHAELRRRDGSLFSENHGLPREVLRLDNYGVDPQRLRNSNRRSIHLTDLALGDGAGDGGHRSDRLSALVDRARARWGAGDSDGAIADLRKATSMRSDTTYYVWAYQMLADIYLDLEQWDEAAKALGGLSSLRPTDVYTSWIRARLAAARGELQLAVSLFSGLGLVLNALDFPTPEEEVSLAAIRAATEAQDERALVVATRRLAEARDDDALRDRADRLERLLTAARSAELG